MAISSRRPRRLGIDIWPGFVDALSQLVMVIVFVLLIFTAGQFYLTEALSGRDAALQRLTEQVNELSEMLALERAAGGDQQLNLSQLSAQLQAANRERDALTAQLADLTAKADAATARANQLAGLESSFDKTRQELGSERSRARDLAGQLAVAQQQRQQAQASTEQLNQQLTAQQQQAQALNRELSAQRAQAQSTIDLLNQQILALREQLAAISAALELSEKRGKEQQTQIADLGKRLNLALASKVEELARYRSEFFGRLREVLGDRPDIRIVGDRFVFQSEVLFEPGSAQLSDAARRQLLPVANALKEIAAKIPPDINWVLRVDGHTDKRPISTPQFPSNWELSTERAISVVRYLAEQGIPPNRLAAAGFGEFQPVDRGDSEEAYRRNRRIELKLTEG
jgi:chemotaxis protein MotB